MTSITIKNCYGSVSVEVDQDDLGIHEMLEGLIKPALLGITYHPNNVDRIIYEEK